MLLKDYKDYESLKKYLFKIIFPFLRSIVEAKSDVEFRQSTLNASKIRLKVGNAMS